MSRRSRSPSERRRRKGAVIGHPGEHSAQARVVPAGTEKTAPRTNKEGDRSKTFPSDPRRARHEARESKTAHEKPRISLLHAAWPGAAIAVLIGTAGTWAVIAASDVLPSMMDPGRHPLRPVVAAFLVAVVLGMRIPGRVASAVNRRTWPLPPADGAAEAVGQLLVRVESPDARLLWTSLSVALLLSALSLAVLDLQVILVPWLHAVLNERFVWSDVTAHGAQLLIAFVILLPQGLLLGTSVSLTQRLVEARGLGVGAWTLAGASGGIAVVRGAEHVGFQGGILLSAAMGLLLVAAILSARVASASLSDAEVKTARSRIQLPAHSDIGRRRLNTGLSALTLAMIWLLAALTRWNLPASVLPMGILALVLSGVRLDVAGRDDIERAGRRRLPRYGATSGIAAMLLVLSALAPRGGIGSGDYSWTTLVLLAGSVAGSGYDLARLRQLSLRGVARAVARDRSQWTRSLASGALVVGVLEPGWNRLADTRLESLLPSIVLIAVGSAIAASWPTAPTWPGRWWSLPPARTMQNRR